MNLCKFKPMCCSVEGSSVFQQHGDLVEHWNIHLYVVCSLYGCVHCLLLQLCWTRARMLSRAAVTLDTCMRAQSHSCVLLFVTPWTVAHQAPLSVAFSGKNTGVGCHFLLQGIFPTQGLNWCLWHLLHWLVDSLPLSHLGSLYAI